MIRGGVVVPGSFSQPVDDPIPGWPPLSAPQPTSESRGFPEASPDAGVDPATAPSASRPLWRRIPLQWLIFAVIMAAGGIGGAIANANRSSSGEIIKGGDLTAADLGVGDCFDLKDPAADEIDEVTAGPCSDAHEYEMFFVGAMPEGSYPADEAMDAFFEANCTGAFDAYIGKAYADSKLEVFTLYPTEEAWRAGDRSMQCSAYHPTIHRLTKSLKGSAQ
jgi:hypothetical protein